MKNSNIAWIGQIPDNWKLERLQWHLDEIKESNDPVQTKQVLSLTNKLGVIPYEQKGEQGNKAKEDVTDYKLAYPNTIVANSMNVLIGSVGKCNYFGCVSPVYYVFKPKEKENIDFINYIFQTEQFQKELRRFANGILEIRLRVSSGDILKREIAFPSFEQQQKIVNFLNKKCSEIDKLIELENKQIENLKEYVESNIFEYLIEELGIEITNNSFTSEVHIKKIGALSDLVTKQTGFDYSNIIKPTMLDNPIENSLPYLQTRNFKNNDFNLNTEFYIPESTWRQFPKLILNNETLLFSIVGASIGNVAVFPKTEVAFLGGAICRVNLIDKDYTLYVKEIMLSKFGQEQINRKINSNAQGTITVQNVRDFLIPMPSKEKAIRIGKKCELMRKEVSDLIYIKEKKIEELQQYKKSIIYEYVTGKKEVQ